MKLPITLLLNYQIEYEKTPDLTIPELCEKYSVETKQLPGYTKWQKETSPTQLTEATIVTEAEPLAPAPKDNKDFILAKDEAELLSQVDEFKTLAMAHALAFMKNDAEFAEVKEFKDVVKIVLDVESSVRVTDTPTTNINILVQNLSKRFDDDC